LQVLEALKDSLPVAPAVRAFVLDFEIATWQALRQVFPDGELHGCCFHWTQAVWRKVQELGLAVTYREHNAAFRFMRKLLALPYLPHEHIAASFAQLRNKAADTVTLQPLMEYVNTTWITSTVWPPSTWTVFNRPVRTNNDVEGWHHRLNIRAGRGQLQFYVFVPLLYRASLLVNIQMRQLSDSKLKRLQRKTYKDMQGKLFKMWEKYIDGDLTASKLLNKAAYLVSPAR
jgi:hypothetical protein